MKKLYFETGKYLYDISKIVLALAVITPFIKDESINVISLMIAPIIFVVGAILIKRSEK